MVAGRLWDNARASFFQRFFGPGLSTRESAESHLTAWWRCVPSVDPRLQPLVEAYIRNGIVSSAAEFMSRAIPYALHGDAVPCTKRMSLDAISFSSCLPDCLSTIDAKWLICGILGRCKAKRSLEVMWSVVIWALSVFSSGTYPLTDFENKQWAPGSDEAQASGSYFSGGFFFVCWMIRGDLDYFSNYLGLNNFNSLFPCWWCD